MAQDHKLHKGGVEAGRWMHLRWSIEPLFRTPSKGDLVTEPQKQPGRAWDGNQWGGKSGYQYKGGQTIPARAADLEYHGDETFVQKDSLGRCMSTRRQPSVTLSREPLFSKPRHLGGVLGDPRTGTHRP